MLIAEKKTTNFVANLLKSGTITDEMAEILSTFKSPHDQLAAMLRRKQEPLISLAEIVASMQAGEVPPPSSAMTPSNRPHRFAFVTWRWFVVLGVLWAVAWGIRALPQMTWTWTTPSTFTSATPASEVITVVNAHPAEPSVPVSHAIHPAARPVTHHAVLAEAPAHFAAKVMVTGLVHLTWDGVEDGQYRLYYGANPAAVTQPDVNNPIPMNWIDWIPPQDMNPVWIAVSRLTADGNESAKSTPLLVSLPKE
jgi:hypothetical protein